MLNHDKTSNAKKALEVLSMACVKALSPNAFGHLTGTI
jgi:hypothetical protein